MHLILFFFGGRSLVSDLHGCMLLCRSQTAQNPL